MAAIVSQDKAARLRIILPEIEQLVHACGACGRHCGADRTAAGTGACRAGLGDGKHARWQSATPHFGEEPMLVGMGGSGTIFFSHCTMRCVFCQNWQISHAGQGRNGDVAELADVFWELQGQGVENINLVTPTQYILPILLALEAAYQQGLNLPLVYNTNGYDSEILIELLDGIVDIWLPDLKYMSSEAALRFSHTADYPHTACSALKAMYKQTGPLQMQNDVAVRGTIVRHLVLPDDLSGSFDFLLWLCDSGMTDITLSLMSQYSPQYQAALYPEIARPVTAKEYLDVVAFAEKLGFEHILTQAMNSRDTYLPDFNSETPFQ